jgi:excinuclease UvrABC nuclease subunit
VLPQQIPFAPASDHESFEQLPAQPAVFLLHAGGQADPYVSKTSNLKRRLERLLGPVDPGSKRLNLREQTSSIEYALTGSDFESQIVLYRSLRAAFPESYRERLKLRFPTLVKFNLENAYPRAHLTRRIARLKGRNLYYGPFATRAAAEKFLNDSLDLFKMRRCDFDLNPDPAFPGCVYSEMKMCLAPCFKGCTDEEYAREVERVQAYFDSGGQSLLRDLETQRERLAERLEFEQAAAVHARLDKVHAALQQQPEIVHRIDQLHGLVIQPSAEKDSVALFRIRAGCISPPIIFAVNVQSGDIQAPKHQSMESRVLAALESQPEEPCRSAAELNEHLAILKRWYFRSRKTGEIFFAAAGGELPMRRVVRGISRVFKGEKPAEDPTETAAREYWLARTREGPPAS